jgi:hypothetical protein
MKFFIKTYYTESMRQWFFKKNYVLDIIAIGIVADNGYETVFLNKEFNARYLDENLMDSVMRYLPAESDRRWVKKIDIAHEVHNFIRYHSERNNSEPELVFENSLDFTAFVALFGGLRQNHKWPLLIPKTYMDIAQSIREYVADMEDEEFMINSNYTRIKIISPGQKFRSFEKMDMFQSHMKYPDREKSTSVLCDARYIKTLYNFFKLVKTKADIQQLQQQISNEDANLPESSFRESPDIV